MAYQDDIERQTMINRLSPSEGGLNRGQGDPLQMLMAELARTNQETAVRQAALDDVRMRGMQFEEEQRRIAADQRNMQSKAMADTLVQQASPSSGIESFMSILANALGAGGSTNGQPKEKATTGGAMLKKKDLELEQLNSSASQITPSPAGLLGGASNNRIVATRQPNGTIAYTNVDTPLNAPPAITPVDTISLSTLDSAIAGLQSTNNPLELATAQSKILEQGNQLLEGMRKSAKDAALKSVGYQALLEDVQKAKLKDDSLRSAGRPELATNALAATDLLNKADKMADETALRAMAGNTTYTTVAAKLSLVDKGPVINALQGEAAIKQRQELIDAEAIATMPPEQVNNIKQLFPDASTDPSAMIKRRKLMTQEEVAAVSVPDSRLAMYVAANPTNKAATQLLVTKMQSAGKSADTITGSVNLLHSTMSDPKKFQEAYNAVFKTGTERKDNAMLLNNVKAGSKEEQAAMQERKSMVVSAYADMQATQAYADTVTSWIPSGVNPEWDKAILANQALGKPPSLENIAMQYIGSDLNGRSGRTRELQKLVTTAVTNQPVSILGNIQLDNMLARIHGMTPSSRANDFVTSVVNGINKTINVPVVGALSLGGLGAVAGLNKYAYDKAMPEINSLFDPAMNPKYNSALEK